MKRKFVIILVLTLMISGFTACDKRNSSLQGSGSTSQTSDVETSNSQVSDTTSQTSEVDTSSSQVSDSTPQTSDIDTSSSQASVSTPQTSDIDTPSSQVSDTTSQTGDVDTSNTQEEVDEETTIINTCEHIWGQWIETVKATCTQSGTRVRKCESCSKEVSEPLEAIPHTDSDWIIDIIPTDQTDGKKHIECVFCKKVIKEEVISQTKVSHNHVADHYVITKQPTCENEGVKEFICSCGVVVKTESISATRHSVVIDNAVLPTCSKSGLTQGKHCSKCNTVIVEQTVVPQTEHTYGPWKILVTATKTQTGMKHKACTVCGWGIVEKIPALQDADPSELNEIVYELRSDGYWVTGIMTLINPILEIPGTYEGKPVVGIAQKALCGDSILEEVIIPDSIKNFEQGVFSKSTALKKVNLPDGIQTIPKEMFYRCKSLTEVNIPASVKEIGSNAFDGCENLNLGTITLDCSMGEFAFRHVQFDTLTLKSKVITNAFHQSRINKLIFAEGVETIADDALTWAKIGDISFPTTLKTIGNSAFYGVDIEKFIFNSAIHFDYGAFNNCKMKEVVILSGSTLDKNVFMNCHQLETIYFSGTRSEWSRLVNGYGYTHSDYQFIGSIHVVCSDD